MLNQYITYEMENLVETPSFRDFLEESRDFLDEFCSHMKKRIPGCGYEVRAAIVEPTVLSVQYVLNPRPDFLEDPRSCRGTTRH